MDILINIDAIIQHDPPGVMGNYESQFQPIGLKAAAAITNWLPVLYIIGMTHWRPFTLTFTPSCTDSGEIQSVCFTWRDGVLSAMLCYILNDMFLQLHFY